MSKPQVFYTLHPQEQIRVGGGPRIFVEGRLLTTSPVLRYNPENGAFETKNTVYRNLEVERSMGIEHLFLAAALEDNDDPEQAGALNNHGENSPEIDWPRLHADLARFEHICNK